MTPPRHSQDTDSTRNPVAASGVCREPRFVMSDEPHLDIIKLPDLVGDE